MLKEYSPAKKPVIWHLIQLWMHISWMLLWITILMAKKLLAYPCFYIIGLALLPMAYASTTSPFPDVTFGTFSEFINNTFGPRISLAAVLTTLFTLTNNPELLNLHARQQLAMVNGENVQILTGWIKSLTRALEERFEKDTGDFFQASEQESFHTSTQVTNAIAVKLDAFSKFLKLSPFDKQGRYQQRLNTISTKEVEGVHVICPDVMECETMSCRPRSLLQDTRDRDVPRVTLIKGIKIHGHVHLLVGKCPDCETRYYADHESSWRLKEHNTRTKFYVNSAKYLKVGQKLWVDRIFSRAIVNGTYSFHASSSAFAEFWNDSFRKNQGTQALKVSRRQMWCTFVQESIRQVAKSSSYTLELLDGLSIEEVTRDAFNILGEGGIIRSAENHFCSECTHNYKRTADQITADDPAALVGVDENRNVPLLQGEDADLAAQDTAQARLDAMNAMNVDEAASDTSMAPVKMVVMDGIVMGHTVCFGHCNI
jgi:hypothetical protein